MSTPLEALDELVDNPYNDRAEEIVRTALERLEELEQKIKNIPPHISCHL